METPLHPTPMQQPMMKGKIDVDASNKPTFHGIWGMTHADVTQEGGLTNKFKVVRVGSVGRDEVGVDRPLLAGKYRGHFNFTANDHTERIKESFTIEFRSHSRDGYNVYGHGENCFGKADIVGTMTKTGEMEIFKMPPGTIKKPAPSPAISSKKPPRRSGSKRKQPDIEGGNDDKRLKTGKNDIDHEEVDIYWKQAQREKREREEREKRRATERKERDEHRIKTLKQKNQEFHEEGLRFHRERAAEKARQEAAKQEKKRLKQKAIEERMAAERRIRDEQRDTIDLDPVRRHPVLMALMDASVYDD